MMDQQLLSQDSADMEQQHVDQYPEFVYLEEDFAAACGIVSEILADDNAMYRALMSNCESKYEFERDRVVHVCEYGIMLMTTVGTPYFAFAARNRLTKFTQAVKGKKDKDFLTTELCSLDRDLKQMTSPSKVKDVYAILYHALNVGTDLHLAAKSAMRILHDPRIERLSDILGRHSYDMSVVA